ncbi:MAG: LamG domain-containing protein, partial [Bacteroidales bacterium]
PISGGTNYGNPQTGNGNTLTFPINGLTQTTSFTILATNTTTGCSVTLDSTFTVHVNPLPNNIGQSAGLSSSLQTGLVAYYPFNGNANDESGNGNNGVVNGATLTTDRFGNVGSAFYFDGVNNNIEVPNSYILNPSLITISLWVKIASGSTLDNMDMVSKDGESFDRQYEIIRSGVNKYRAHFASSGSFCYYDGTTSPLLETWYHVVQTFDGTTLKLFVNGQYESGTIYCEAGVAQSTQPLRFGGGAPAGLSQYFFNGSLDEVKIYNRALSIEEIDSIYSSESEILEIALVKDTICSGSNTSLTIQNSQTGISYQPFSSGTNFGNPQTGNGNTLTFPINGLTQTTSFTILATNTTTGCSVILDSTFTVRVNSLPNNIGQVTGLSSLQNGLVAHYPFNGNANDESGNGYNGIVTGAQLSSDRCANTNASYNFNGTLSNYLSVDNFPLLNQNFSYSCWIKINGLTGGIQSFGALGPTSGQTWNFAYNANTKNWDLFDITNSSWYTFNPLQTTDTLDWTNVTVVYNGNVEYLYVNGSLLNQRTIISPVLDGGGRTFLVSLNGSQPLNGKVDEIRIYNRPLSPQDVSAIFLSGCNYLSVQLSSDT